jgi:DNA-binding NarL/FixJ family response regulator
MTKILIVDDNAQVRNALRICLQMNQMHEVCGEAENGCDGVELAKRLKPDIVLLDYAMPTMNGLEAARLISSSMPQCGRGRRRPPLIAHGPVPPPESGPFSGQRKKEKRAMLTTTIV